MNQKLFFILISFALVLITNFSITYADEGIFAKLIVPADFATVGDIVELKVEVTHPAGYRLVPLDLPSPWGELEIRSLSHVTVQEETNGMTRSSQTIFITLWVPGEYETPPLAVQISDSTGQVQEVNAGSAFLSVESVLTEDRVKLRDLKEQLPLPPPSIWPLAIGGGLLGWLLLALAWWLYHTWQKRKAQVPQQTPDLRSTYQKTLDELERINGLNLPTQGQFKAHYTLLSDAIRRYLEETYQIQASEQTTEEIQGALLELAMASEHKNQLLEFLHHADMVKFANVVPDLLQAREQTELAREFVLMSQTVMPDIKPDMTSEMTSEMTPEMTPSSDDEPQPREEVTS